MAMNGKSRCKVLKEIRQKIAKENEIELDHSECDYQGECSGTCPKCEAEVRTLETELAKRSKLGKIITISGLALALTGCQSPSDSLASRPDVRGKMPARVIEETEETESPTNGSENLPVEKESEADTISLQSNNNDDKKGNKEEDEKNQ